MVHSAARRPLAAAGWWAVLLTALVARGAAAADAADVTIERMRLSSERGGILSVESGGVLPHLGVAGSLWVGYANDELVLHRLPDGPRVGSLVNDRWGGAVSASVGLLDRAQLSLEVPVTFYQDRSGGGLVASARSLDAFGVGSLRLVPKVRLLEEGRHGVDLAVQVGVTAPLGADSYIGSEWTAQPEVAASRTVGDVRLGVNLGAALRERARLADERLGSELLGQVGAAYGLERATGLPVELGAVLAAAASAAHPFEREDETSVEARGYGAIDVAAPVRVLAGAGLGLVSGWGTPDWRVFAGLQVTIPRKATPAPVAAPPPPAPAPKPPPPPPDRDGDGIPDAQDRCPTEPGPAANHGCPDTDRDKDGVVDRLDACPDLPGPRENRGCPVKGPAKLEGDRIELGEVVYFDTAKDTIQRRSDALLDSVATIVKAHPEIGKLRVEGHTDAQGARAYNVKLSQRRAAAVVKALVKRGVPAERLVAQGFGPDQPVADNATAEGRAKNRRVEVRVVDSKGGTR